jgi:Peptidoglycan-binding protein, CsiV
MLNHFMNRSLGILVTTILSFGLVLPVSAQEVAMKQYEVELVVFRVMNPTGSPEDWAMEELRSKAIAKPEDGDEPAGITDSTLNTPATAPTESVSGDTSTQLLESARFKLTPIESTLKRSRGYQPLAHIGWSQPGFARENPRPLGIENLVPGTGLTGSVSLTRGARLLHLQFDLTYTAADGQRYTLREHRAIRSGDKHYFDHPQFGVIAVVTPKAN